MLISSSLSLKGLELPIDISELSSTSGGPKDQSLSVVGKCTPVRNYNQASEWQAVLKCDHSQSSDTCQKKLCCQDLHEFYFKEARRHNSVMMMLDA